MSTGKIGMAAALRSAIRLAMQQDPSVFCSGKISEFRVVSVEVSRLRSVYQRSSATIV